DLRSPATAQKPRSPSPVPPAPRPRRRSPTRSAGRSIDAVWVAFRPGVGQIRHGSSLAEHPVIADDGRLTGPRRIDGPVSDSFLKGAKRFELCKSAACILMDVGHEVNEGSVGQPQSHVMNALRMARVQFLEHAPDQL